MTSKNNTYYPKQNGITRESAPYGLFRTLLLLFVLSGTGMVNVWGQTLDEGFYFIANGNKSNDKTPKSQYDSSDKTKNYYLTAATGKYYKDNNGTTTAVTTANDTPFLTTYMSFNHDASSGALWEVKKIVSGDDTYYQFIHVEDGKYLTANPHITVSSYRRVSVHLEQMTNTTDINNTLFVVTQVSGQSYYTICHKDVENSSLNPASGNFDQTGPRTDKGGGYGGLIGWGEATGDINSFWYFEDFTLSELAISVNVPEATFSITADSIPTGCSIHYTTGDGTQDAPTATTGNVYTTNTPVAIDDFTNVKAAVVGHQLVLSAVANEVKCATPVFSFSQNTNIYDVTVETATSGATLYYTIGTNPADPTASEGGYDGTGSSPLEIPNVTSTIKVIAAKEGLVNSPVLAFVANPTISLEYDTHVYAGIELEPSVSINGGSIPSGEYIVTYSNHKNVGTATATVANKPGSNYYVTGGSVNFEITKASLTITAEAKSKEYGDDDPALTYTSEGLVGTDAITGALSREAGEAIGTYAIYQNTVTASSNYTITYTGADFTIAKKTLTITAKPQTITYGEEPTNNGVTYSGFAGTETKDVLTGELVYTYNYAQYDNAGDYDITPSGLTGDNYDITYNNGTLTVNPKEVSLTWGETTSFVYDATNHAPSATVTGLLNGDEVGVNVTGQETNVGDDYTATASGLTGDKGVNYTLDATYTKKYSITPAALTIKAKNHTIYYGDAPANYGVDYDGFAGSDNAEVLGGTLDYDYSYTQYGDVGNTYTITPKGLTSVNYEITFAAGTLTVNAKEVSLSWGETTFEYDGSPHAPIATAIGLVNSDVVTVTVTGAQINVGNYTATASALTGDKAGNYLLPDDNTQSFTISRRNIGSGTLVSGYTLDFGEDNTILLTDDNIGRTLVLSTDYSVGDDTDPSAKYSERRVTGQGNYTGYFDVRNVVISFTTDTDQEDWSATFSAEKADESDVGLALPEGVSAFIISGIQGEWAIPEPLNYIPAGVPVLLVAHKKINGFVATQTESGDVTPITDVQKTKNMLEEVTETTPGYDPVSESAPFATKQIYLLYKNEFVFNKAGNMKKGKVYLNPNHAAPSPEPAPSRLQIAWNYTTGIEDGKGKMDEGRSERWYTLDGRCLSGKPDAKGLYIVGGKKIVVK